MARLIQRLNLYDIKQRNVLFKVWPRVGQKFKLGFPKSPPNSMYLLYSGCG